MIRMARSLSEDHAYLGRVRASRTPSSGGLDVVCHPSPEAVRGSARVPGKATAAESRHPDPEGEVASTPEEARAAAERIGGTVVVKAQVQIGGRGKAGGIKVATTPDEARRGPARSSGMDIRGHTVHRVWIEEASAIAKEYYASITFDRAAKSRSAMLSAIGGMDIEEVAAPSRRPWCAATSIP